MEEITAEILSPQEQRRQTESRLIGHFNMAMAEPTFSEFMYGHAQVPESKKTAYHRMYNTELAGLYAYPNLPDNPQDRVTLLRRSQNQMDGDFGDGACVTMSAYLRNSKEILSAWGEDWRHAIDYDPKRIPLDEATQSALDRLDLFVQIPTEGPRNQRLHTLIETAIETQIISPVGAKDLRQDLEPLFEDLYFQDQVASLGYDYLHEALHDRPTIKPEAPESDELSATARSKWGRHEPPSSGIAKQQFVELHGHQTKRKDRPGSAIQSSKSSRADRWGSKGSAATVVIEKQKLRQAPDIDTTTFAVEETPNPDSRSGSSKLVYTSEQPTPTIDPSTAPDTPYDNRLRAQSAKLRHFGKR